MILRILRIIYWESDLSITLYSLVLLSQLGIIKVVDHHFNNVYFIQLNYKHKTTNESEILVHHQVLKTIEIILTSYGFRGLKLKTIFL